MENFTEIQKDAFTEVGDFIMGAAASVLSGVAGNEVTIDSPRIDTVLIDEAKATYTSPVVLIDIKYNAGFTGSSSFVFEANEMAVLYNQAGGLDPGEPADLNNIADSELGDVIGQMVNQVVNAMSEIFDRMIVIGPPEVRFISPDEADEFVPWGSGDDEVLKIDYSFTMDSVFESSLTQLIPMPLAISMVNILLSVDEDDDALTEEPELSPVNDGDFATPPPLPDEDDGGQDIGVDEFIIPEEESLANQPLQDGYAPEDLSELRGAVSNDVPPLPEDDFSPPESRIPDFSASPDFDLPPVSSDDLTLSGGPEPEPEPPADDSPTSLSEDELSRLIGGLDIDEVAGGNKESGAADDFAAFMTGGVGDKKEDSADFHDPLAAAADILGGDKGDEEDKPLTYEESIKKLELLKDIPIELTVIMGENSLPLKELVNAGKGSLVSLRRYAREPVDIMVNDQMVARGEVVVVDGRIGVRIVSIETRLPQLAYEQSAK